ncbi:MAG: chemotaxis protein CheC, partial [Clostridiales bacterium]|jgi:chemotaxis protein CheC|nr:chemotaxis protein CheC [Clostridiales bacterium]
MPDNVEMMNAMQLDVFREIGNIGSSSAATALSKLVDKRIALSLPRVRILKFDEITQIVGGEEALVVGIMQPIQGDLTGNILFLLRLQEAHDLASIVISRMLNVAQERKEPGVFDEMELSALREVGNIMISSYLSAISAMTNLSISSKVPDMALDMAGAILSVLTIEFGKVGDRVLYIESEFSQDNIKVGGDFFLVPDIASYSILLKALGVG